MKLKNYTSVKLKDGRKGAIVEVFDGAYLVDVSGPEENDPAVDWTPEVREEDIEAYYKDGHWINL